MLGMSSVCKSKMVQGDSVQYTQYTIMCMHVCRIARELLHGATNSQHCGCVLPMMLQGRVRVRVCGGLSVSVVCSKTSTPLLCIVLCHHCLLADLFCACAPLLNAHMRAFITALQHFACTDMPHANCNTLHVPCAPSQHIIQLKPTEICMMPLPQNMAHAGRRAPLPLLHMYELTSLTKKGLPYRLCTTRS